MLVKNSMHHCRTPFFREDILIGLIKQAFSRETAKNAVEVALCRRLVLCGLSFQPPQQLRGLFLADIDFLAGIIPQKDYLALTKVVECAFNAII